LRIKHFFMPMAVSMIGAFAAGCVGSSAPRYWLPSADHTITDTYGAWASVQLISQHDPVEGELIASSRDSVFILTDKLTVLCRDSIDQIKLARYSPSQGGIATWTLIGSLSTLSHGYLLVASLPAWIITGSVAASAVSHEPIIEERRGLRNPLTGTFLERLSRYSRFPQGLPATVDRLSLRPK
jgi:hypothetical protein